MFFVDEIHRLPRAVEETFYPAMEDRQLPITVGTGAGARVVTLDLPPFTLIGATTRAGLLTTPLRDRFGIQHRLDHYDADDLARIVTRSARVLDVQIDAGRRARRSPSAPAAPRASPTACCAACATTPRSTAAARSTPTVAGAALDLLEVDHEGLDRLDREILSVVCRQFSGGPVGLSTLAVAVQEEADTIEDVYEPYLLQRGFLQRTPRGRCATAHAFRHLGLEPPDDRLDVVLIEPLHARDYAKHPMAHLFICPNCGSAYDRGRPPAGLPQPATRLLEVRLRLPVRAARRLLPGPNAAFFVCDQNGRIIGCGRGSRELTGLSDEKVMGREVREVLGLDFEGGADHVGTVLEWGVRQLGKAVVVNAEGDLPAKAVADLFPAYDDDGGLLLVLTPSK